MSATEELIGMHRREALDAAERILENSREGDDPIAVWDLAMASIALVNATLALEVRLGALVGTLEAERRYRHRRRWWQR